MRFVTYINTVVIWATILFVAPTMKAQSTIKGKTLAGGIIEGEQTWTLAESPFVVNKDIHILPGAKLNIEQGVIIGVAKDLHFYVEGDLDIQGSVEEPVLFTSVYSSMFPGSDTNQWGGIVVYGDKANLSAQFMVGFLARHVFQFEVPTTGKVKISHSYLRANESAFEFVRTGADFIISNNQIIGNDVGFLFHSPIPEKRVYNNQIEKNQTADLVNLSGKPINLSENCWSKTVAEKAQNSRFGGYPGALGAHISIIPVHQSCQPVSDLFLISGGDITVVLDDDLVGTPIELNQSPEISVYPNPATNHFKIQYGELFPENLTVVNSLGQIILFKSGLSMEETEVSVETWPAGIYYLHLKTRSGVIQTRVVVMKNW
ncbi:MAG: T9SS type A sorting domain-containing protein [Bacteroidetes bacterium]|nr:T9SS type A sorting domain-containing protein [Bacteroidota bacterium]MCB0845302.1 T9SS type A sorting domain-containing protein [Bacteroidota bacterium]